LNKGKKGLQINEKDVHIFKPQWMLYQNKRENGFPTVPNRAENILAVTATICRCT